MPEDSKSLAAVIEAAMDPIEKAFSSVLEGVHKHGALEEREAVVKEIRTRAATSKAAGCSGEWSLLDGLANIFEAGEHRQP